MHTRRSLAIAVGVAATLLAAFAPVATFAATTGVECGIINAYTAPVGPTDGSIQFGFTGPTETILAAATMDPAVLANLTSQTGNGSITCLDVTADGSGDITALAYASSGQVSGLVTYDSVQDAYIVADRIFVPTSQLVAQPDLIPIVKVPYEAGQTLTVSFTIDTSNGNLNGVSTASQVSGPVAFNGGGDVLIQGATIPAASVTGDPLGALHVAATTGSDADVDITGSIDTTTGNFVLALGVDTIGCTTVDARSGSSITLDGVAFALGSGNTAAASLTTGAEVGVRVQVATSGTVTITEVSVPGCGSVAPIAPPPTDTDADPSGAMSEISDFSSLALLAGVLIAWYGAAVAIRRRTTRPTQDR